MKVFTREVITSYGACNDPIIIGSCVNTFIYSHVGLPGHVPQLQELAKEVVDKVAYKWIQLALSLGLSGATIDAIRYDYQTLRACCVRMFEQWLKDDTTASWSKLVAALRSKPLSFHALAARLERNHPDLGTDDG